MLFPAYYFGQIFEARHEPGTMAYSAEAAIGTAPGNHRRDGAQRLHQDSDRQRPRRQQFLLPFFAQSQLAAPHDYVVYVWMRDEYPPGRPALKPRTNACRRIGDRAHHDLAPGSGASRSRHSGIRRRSQPARSSQRRLHRNLVVREISRPLRGRWSVATKELGEFDMKAWSDDVANSIRAIKSDQRQCATAARVLRIGSASAEDETVRICFRLAGGSAS